VHFLAVGHAAAAVVATRLAPAFLMFFVTVRVHSCALAGG
jgi:hypothetical protein